MKIIPAILTNNIEEFNSLVMQVSSKYSRVQVDFVDGEYANNLTLRPAEVDIVPYPQISFDAHLMVTENNLLNFYLTAQKKGFSRVIVQAESIAKPEDYDCLSLDIHSPLALIKPFLSKLKYINLMSIEPGFGGQKLDFTIFNKISYLRPLGNFTIAVDGGVEKEHLQKLEELGVDEVVVGAARMLEWK
jgi:ribulose-phosphate 3-epimerase